MLQTHLVSSIVSVLLFTKNIVTAAIFAFQYDTDFYILDKFPLAVRPFYTMPDPNDKVM